jgi:hypothetical protein
MLKSSKSVERGWRAWAGIVFVCVLASCGGDDGGSGPVIHDIAPAAAAPGATVELLGNRFCGDDPDAVREDGSCVVPPAGLISFGAGDEAVRALGIQSWRHQRIEVAVPSTAGPGATVVIVTVNGVASNEYPFEVQ